MRTLLQDLTYGLRQLRKSPGFTTVAILTLALGIGANTAIFTLVHAIVLQPLPVKDPGSLYRVGSPNVDCCVTGGLQDIWDVYSYPLYKHILEDTPEFQVLSAFQAGETRLSVRRAGENGAARPLLSELVTGNYFPCSDCNPLPAVSSLSRRPAKRDSRCGDESPDVGELLRQRSLRSWVDLLAQRSAIHSCRYCPRRILW